MVHSNRISIAKTVRTQGDGVDDEKGQESEGYIVAYRLNRNVHKGALYEKCNYRSTLVSV